MTLIEGRNRQIRKMMEGMGFDVVKLHRVEFMGIQLNNNNNNDDSNDKKKKKKNNNNSSGLVRPGDWAYLNEDEMKLVHTAIAFGLREMK